MKKHCKNSISIVYLLFCLFITSASAISYIRQFTDGGNTNLLEDNQEEISSRDYKVSDSSILKGFRTRPPSSYSLKLESFNPLPNSTKAERYESRPFSALGYNWTLVVYPNGNKNDGGADHLSLYIAIDKSPFVSAAHQEVDVDLRFYIFNKKEEKYLTIQDTDVWRFNVSKTMWGFSKALPLNVFRDKTQGYLYDGDQCEFGVDVTLPLPLFQTSELFSVTEKSQKFTWTLLGFSNLNEKIYYSDVFNIGGINWRLDMFPHGYHEDTAKALSLFLFFNGDVKLRPYEKVYVRAKLRVLNQRQLGNIEQEFDTFYIRVGLGAGSFDLISFDDLRDSSKGFVVNDKLTVQLEMEAFSSTTYFPS